MGDNASNISSRVIYGPPVKLMVELKGKRFFGSGIMVERTDYGIDDTGAEKGEHFTRIEIDEEFFETIVKGYRASQ